MYSSIKAVPNVAAISETVTEAPDWKVVVVIASVVLLFALYHYLRLLYPCLTISALDNTEKSLEDAYTEARRSACLQGDELENTTQSKLRSNDSASEIRAQSLQDPSSTWKAWLIIKVELIPSIVAWYEDADRLRRDILIIIENNKRSGYIAELQRRQRMASRSTTTRTNDDVQPVTSSGHEAVAPRGPPRHRTRRPDVSVSDALPSPSTTTEG
ncbi:40S ribosomal protein S6 [Paramarasmius palmivorus]|uniref:40S ribosomal protein S6 n=1 Tax=Paramarasmius palmivorus TaxID=297713 RepID=A0AAW0CTK4_9AGAR